MSTIQLSPELHIAVKWNKESALKDASFVVRSLSSMLSTTESKALSNVFSNKGKKEQEEPMTSWT